MRVLIVEDTRAFGELIAQSLERASIDSDLVFTATDAESALARINYEAIVLDLGLPDRDGLDLLRELRARRDTTPVLIISARHGFQDRVLGLKEGADDYLPKPFAMDELVARLQAVLRRPPALAGDLLRAGNVSLDPRSRLVRVDGRVQEVRLRETLVLELLMGKFGQVVRRNLILDRLFGVDGEQSSAAVDVYIHRLRRLLAEAGATVVIHTVHGLGYMMIALKQQPKTHKRHPREANCAH